MKKNDVSTKIIRNLREYAHRHGFKNIAAAISGGPDSVALLSALHEAGLNVTALHCNFHLRGDESMRDQISVEKLCGKLDVGLFSKDFDVAAYIMQNKGVSVEMACRDLRYDWFKHMANILKAERIATGHNSDDNIETLFLNLLRGSGTSGLKGISPDNGQIWRPMLHFSRKEILEYLKIRNISYVTDSTNLESNYRRNFIRNEIMPLLRSRWPGADTALQKSLKCLNSENAIVEEALHAELLDDDNTILVSKIIAFPAPELLIRRFILKAGPFSTTASEILAAISAAKPDARKWKLKNACVLLKGGKLSIHEYV